LPIGCQSELVAQLRLSFLLYIAAQLNNITKNKNRK
jgi:hypothetical protein